MTQRGQWLVVLVIVGIIVGGVIAGMAVTPALQPVGVQSDAPGFEAMDIATGDTVALSSFEGDVVLLNIWATWCVPCETEMPSIQRLHDQMAPEGLKVIAVSVDNVSTATVVEWIEERGLTFQVLHDESGRIQRTYQTTGVPETFVIDRHGVIVKKVIGATEWDHPVQITLIRRLLGGTDDELAESGG